MDNALQHFSIPLAVCVSIISHATVNLANVSGVVNGVWHGGVGCSLWFQPDNSYAYGFSKLLTFIHI